MVISVVYVASILLMIFGFAIAVSRARRLYDN